MPLKFDDQYFDAVTLAIEEAETRTSAEIVVVIHPNSGSYRDVDLLFGATLGWLGLVFAIFNPWTVHTEDILALEELVLFVVGVVASMSCPPLRRLLTTSRRRATQVRETSEALFVQYGVANTRERTGILLYLSRFERVLEVLPDVGITDHANPETWNQCVFKLKHAGQAPDPAQALLDGIGELGRVLAEPLPPSDDNPDELPNRPRTPA